MRNRSLCLAVITLVFGGFALSKSIAGAGPDDERIAQLIKQLGSSRYADREKATRGLESIGVAALEQLRLATKDADLEVSRRCQELVRKLEDKLAADALLAPKKVKLSLKDVPVTAVIAELQQQSGYAINVEGAFSAHAPRKISLETGEVTFFEAFEKLCQVAGLQGTRSDPADLFRQALNVQQAIQVQQLRKLGKGQQQPVLVPAAKVGVKTPLNSSLTSPADGFVVREALTQQIPTSLHGAVRFRLLPANPAIAIPLPHQGLFVLDVTAEPSIQQFYVDGSLRLDKAIDDQGQQLTLVPEQPSNHNGQFGDPFSQVLFAKPRQLVLRLKLGEKPAKSLKKLSGSVTVRGQHPAPEALITLDDVMHAAGKTARGRAGGFLELLNIAKQANGVYTVQIRFEDAQQGVPGNGQMIFMQGANGGAMQVIQVNGNLQLGGNPDLPVLVDAKGKKLNLERLPQTVTRLVAGQVSREIHMVFRADAGVGEPTQMVLFGHRMVTATVPFRFENVALPGN
jgi:hypothetical protein